MNTLSAYYKTNDFPQEEIRLQYGFLKSRRKTPAFMRAGCHFALPVAEKTTQSLNIQ